MFHLLPYNDMVCPRIPALQLQYMPIHLRSYGTIGQNFKNDEKKYKNKSVVKPVPGIITMGNTELVLTLLLVQTN